MLYVDTNLEQHDDLVELVQYRNVEEDGYELSAVVRTSSPWLL